MTLSTVDLMHATIFFRPIHHHRRIYEEKLDGYRMLTHKFGDACPPCHANSPADTCL